MTMSRKGRRGLDVMAMAQVERHVDPAKSSYWRERKGRKCLNGKVLYGTDDYLDER